MRSFKLYLSANFANKKIIEVTKTKRDGKETIPISIFPNAVLYSLNGDILDDTVIVKIWKIIYASAKKGQLQILNK